MFNEELFILQQKYTPESIALALSLCSLANTKAKEDPEYADALLRKAIRYGSKQACFEFCQLHDLDQKTYHYLQSHFADHDPMPTQDIEKLAEFNVLTPAIYLKITGNEATERELRDINSANYTRARYLIDGDISLRQYLEDYYMHKGEAADPTKVDRKFAKLLK